MLKNQNGFNLVELMVVIVIISLLATLAIPRFSKSIHRTKAAEFSTVLMSIYSAELNARDETGSYVPIEELDVDEDSYVKSPYFVYEVTSGNWQTEFLATATVKAPGIGNAREGMKASIDQTGAKTGDRELLQYVKLWK